MKRVLWACLYVAGSTATVSVSASAPKPANVCDRVAGINGVPPSMPGSHGAWTVYDCAPDSQKVCNVDVRLFKVNGRYVVDTPWLVTFNQSTTSMIQWNFVATKDAESWGFDKPVDIERNCVKSDENGDCIQNSTALFGSNKGSEKAVTVTPKTNWFRVSKYTLYINIDNQCVKWGPMVVNRGGD